jgi:hypothetical protein
MSAALLEPNVDVFSHNRDLKMTYAKRETVRGTPDRTTFCPVTENGGKSNSRSAFSYIRLQSGFHISKVVDRFS